jgi:hypothetical protein
MLQRLLTPWIMAVTLCRFHLLGRGGRGVLIGLYAFVLVFCISLRIFPVIGGADDAAGDELFSLQHQKVHDP